ncbi:MAG TPA: hypothetical protein VGN80_17315 [Devosiaceae bacterium]|jgi:hypothetical protein|nr:hypothetical protein [Devosiaceae bacterium]
MKRLAAALLLACLATPAQASMWINCSDAGGEASFDYLIGTVPALSIVALTVSVGELVWASDVAYGPGEPIAVGQAFEDEQMILIDALDPAMTERLASLRLFKAAEGDAPMVYAGTLHIPGHGAWAVSCAEG